MDARRAPVVGGRKKLRLQRPKRRLRAGSQDEYRDQRGCRIQWCCIGFSILMVVGISFLNFMSLPNATPASPFGPHVVNKLGPGISGELSDRVRRKDAASGGQPSPPVTLDIKDHVAAAAPAPSGDGFLARAKSPSETMQAMPSPPPSAPSTSSHTVQPTVPNPSRLHEPSPLPRTASQPLPTAAVRNPQSVQQVQTPQALATLPKQKQGGTPMAPSTVGGMAMFDGEEWLSLRRHVDAEELTFGAWIFVPNVPDSGFPFSSGSLKTIAATKVSGCRADLASAQGWAFFVHEWGTTNQQLRFSWSDSASACHEIFSKTALVPFDAWTHVGFSLSHKRNRVRLFINGLAVVDTTLGLGDYARQGTAVPMAQALITSRKITDSSGQAGIGLFVGGHAPQTNDPKHAQSHLFLGFLGDLWLLHKDVDDIGEASRLLRSADPVLTSAMVASVTFRVGQQIADSVSSTPLSAYHSLSGAHDILLSDFTDKPKHPATVANAPVESTVPPPPSPPGPTLESDALKKTWPEAWTKLWSEQELLASQREADPWTDEVRDAMRHTWRGYKAKGWGRDEVRPGTGQAKDWCRMAVTMVDGLSTLYLMGLMEEFDESYKFVETSQMPTAGKHGQHSLFEITIRVFGGLLSAYSLSEKPAFLDAARRLADRMLPAYATPKGLPMSTFDVGTGEAKWHTWAKAVILAEATTTQLELRYLTHVTKDPKYQAAGDRAMNSTLHLVGSRGIVPIRLSKEGDKFVGAKISFGAMGDSYYEYLLKQWIQNGKKDDYLKDAWKRAMKEMMDKLIVKTAGGLTFVAEMEGTARRDRMDHLACFVAGMLMLGSRTLPKEEVDPRWEPTAAELTYTCYQMYKRQPTGISAEYYSFDVHASSNDMKVPKDAPHYLLRPEAAEAIYYMYYYTGDPKYRRWAYEMFSAINKHCRSRFGYSAIADVRNLPVRLRDSQESFWLAETLKYFYLIFAPHDTLNLEQWVLNTEAQPLRMWS